MKEPRRLTEERDTSPFARSLLDAGRARHAPRGAQERVWSALSSGLVGGAAIAAVVNASSKVAVEANGVGAGTSGVGAGASGVGGGVAAGGAGAKGVASVLASTTAKLLIGGVAMVGAVAMSVDALTTSEAVEPSTTTAPLDARESPRVRPSLSTEERDPARSSDTSSPVPSREPTLSMSARAPAIAPAPTPQVSVGASPSPASPSPLAPRPPSSSALREEASLLRESRAALGAGDLGVARSKLDEARRRFASGQLAPERDAVEIRIVAASGDKTRAATLARAFVARWPDSPLRSGIEALALTDE